MKTLITTAALFIFPAISIAQVPVDDNGKPIGSYASQADIVPIVDDGIPHLSQAELQDLGDKKRAGKPVATQLRDIDARIKRKAKQLEKKDNALEALRSEREEV